MEIKRCPFCGGNDFDITPESAYYNMRRDYKLSRVTITCKDCEAEMHRVDGGEMKYKEALESLITAWNTRVMEAVDGLIEEWNKRVGDKKDRPLIFGVTEDGEIVSEEYLLNAFNTHKKIISIMRYLSENEENLYSMILEDIMTDFKNSKHYPVEEVE